MLNILPQSTWENIFTMKITSMAKNWEKKKTPNRNIKLKNKPSLLLPKVKSQPL